MSFKKYHKSLFKKKVYLKNYNYYYFDFIIISRESSIFTFNQYVCLQKIILKVIKQNNSFCFNFVKPYFFLTKKASESRMGGGKGNLEQKIFYVKKGQILYGLKSISFYSIHSLFSLVASKLAFKISLIKIHY